MSVIGKILVQLGCLMFCMTTAAWGEGMTFGLLSKRFDDQNFVEAARGCQDAAALNGDRCIHIGAEGAASPRTQVAALEKALETEELSALAISVVMSDFLADAVRRKVSVPVITYDSNFNEEGAALSMAYVGIDNIAFGRDLASVANKLCPVGGSVFLMGDLHDTNLAERIQGVRQGLSGDDGFPVGQRLDGEGGWTESARSPWNSGDDVQRTMQQLTLTLDRIRPDLFIAVGHWPVVDPEAFRKTTVPYQRQLTARETTVVVGVGKILPEYQSLLEKGLVHGFVSIDFYRTGQLCYGIMQSLATGKSVSPETYIPNTILMAP